MSAHRPPRSRWLSPRPLGAAGAVLLAGVLGAALLLHDQGGACAALPEAGKQVHHSGKATFYDLGGGQGNCSAPPPADDLYVALGPDEYAGAVACGSYLDVTGPKGKVRVKVFDKCPECAAGHLDLSRTAFLKIADEVQGIAPITYRTVVDPAVPGALSFTFKEGSSQFWWAVLVDNHGNALTSVQAKGPGRDWRTATRADFNFWIIDEGAGSGPFQIKLTDVYGNTATAANIKLKPEQRQTSTVRLSGGGSVSKAESTAQTAEEPAAKTTTRPAAQPKKTAATVPSSTPSVSRAPAEIEPSKSVPVPGPTTQDLALTAAEPTSSC